MNVTTIRANIRYSAEAKGAWRTIEVGAEATVAPDEDWQTALGSANNSKPSGRKEPAKCKQSRTLEKS
jgi:hypothetical protein